MNTKRLLWKDVALLSMVNCKVCGGRVQLPVMKVEFWGNICGRCYDRSTYTHVTQDVEVELLLSKFSTPCNYVRNGCNYEDAYENTCNHEKLCCFRDRICPFVYINRCNQYAVPDIIGHIYTMHNDNVLEAQNNTVLLTNPYFPETETFYLLVFELRYGLLRISFGMELICYILYYIDNNKDVKHPDEIPFSFTVEHGNVDVTYRNGSMLHESNIEELFDYDRAIQVKFAMLNSVGCTKILKIVFDFNEKKTVFNEKVLNSFTCLICKSYCMGTAHFCAKCGSDIRYCSNCYALGVDACPKCGLNNYEEIDVNSWCKNFRYPCQNEGCDDHIWGGEFYQTHSTQCILNKFACPVAAHANCSTTALYTDLPLHLTDKHPELLNTESIAVDVTNFASYKTRCFIINNNVVRCDYRCTIPGELSLIVGIIGPAQLSHPHMWKLVISKGTTGWVNAFECSFQAWKRQNSKTLDVSPYITKNKVRFNIYIERIYA